MSTYGTTSVTMVGHSLGKIRYSYTSKLRLPELGPGAAITLLDSVYLPLWLPAGTTFKTVGYGLPRVR